MVQPDPPARVPRVDPADYTDEHRAFFEKWAGGDFQRADENPVLRTFAHHPKLAGLFSELNVHLLRTNTVPVKLRQIAIMRLAWITKTTYMWSSHLNTSRLFGLSDEMYRPLQVGASDPYFTDFERWVIRATEELVNDYRITDESWAALMQEWDYAQMLDFMFTVGCYGAVAGVMKSTGTERDPDLLALAEKYGAPE
jgi:4-carboxymuconolactone decarboxylase